MLSDSYDKLNEYDKILSSAKCDKFNPVFLVIEDLKNKCWIVYDGNTGKYCKQPFGHYVAAIINAYVNFSINAVHHNQFNDVIKNGILDEDNINNYFLQTQKAFKNLLDIFLHLSYWKKVVEPDRLDQILLNEWKFYRYAASPQVWADCAKAATETFDEFKNEFSKMNFFSNNELKEMYDSEKMYVSERLETLHEVIKKIFFVYYDELIFLDMENKQHYGRAFLTTDEEHIFSLDLYHILISGVTPVPHICPHCNQIFFSNNNKIIYCEDCQSEKNVIRNQKRKQSVRYIHKKIYDKLNNSKKYTNETRDNFLNESNYYWDCVLKRDTVKNPLFTEKIETEQQYKEWLENKLNSY